MTDFEYEEKITMRRRFKSLVRLAYFNAYWLNDFEGETLGLSMAKNIRLITEKRKHQSLISIKYKAMLNKEEEDRLETEKNPLMKVLRGLRCFSKYPAETISQLAATAIFVYFPPGRYIIREDDPPLGWYYILGGKVSVRRNKYSDKGVTETELCYIQKGHTFGEFAMLHNTPRSRSIVTSTHCEMLTIDRDQFDSIIKETVMDHYETLISYMKHLPYFESYDNDDFTEACLVAKLRQYEHNEVILGDDEGYPDHTYFIIDGRVKIIHHLMFKVRWDETSQKDQYEVYDPFSDPNNEYFVKKEDTGETVEDPDIKYDNEKCTTWNTPPPVVDYFQVEMVKKLPEDIHATFIKIYTLRESGCFNVGEDLKNRFIIACTASLCTCLLLPRDWLFRRNIAYIWTRLAEFFNLKIPTDEVILKKYVERRQWELQKRKLIKKIMKNSNLFNKNTINNVPYSLRMAEDLSLYKDAFSTFSPSRGLYSLR